MLILWCLRINNETLFDLDSAVSCVWRSLGMARELGLRRQMKWLHNPIIVLQKGGCIRIMKNAKERDYLENLRDRTINDINRTIDMVCFSLTKSPLNADEFLKTEEVSEFSLHVQCSCRMIGKESGKIIFASNDRFEPKSTEEWTDDFDWDIQGGNLFDEISKEWLSKNKDVTIRDFQFNEIGDLSLSLSNGDVFEIFVDISSGEEAWRFFEYNDHRKHFVVSSESAQFDD